MDAAPQEPPRPGTVSRPLTALALACAGLLVLVLGLGARLPAESPVTAFPSFDTTPPPPPTVPPRPPVSLPPLPRSETGPLGDGLGALTEALVPVLVALALAVLVVAVVLAVRVVRGQERPGGVEEDLPTVVDVEEVQALLERSQNQIGVDGDVNRAVVRCWQGLELLAADAGVAREPSQTAREYTLAVLAGAALPVRPLERLADLYEEALFSGARLPETARAEAMAALTGLRAGDGSGVAR